MRLDDGVLHLDKEFSLLDEFVIDVTRYWTTSV